MLCGFDGEHGWRPVRDFELRAACWWTTSDPSQARTTHAAFGSLKGSRMSVRRRACQQGASGRGQHVMVRYIVPRPRAIDVTINLACFRRRTPRPRHGDHRQPLVVRSIGRGVQRARRPLRSASTARDRGAPPITSWRRGRRAPGHASTDPPTPAVRKRPRRHLPRPLDHPRPSPRSPPRQRRRRRHRHPLDPTNTSTPLRPAADVTTTNISSRGRTRPADKALRRTDIREPLDEPNAA